MKVSIWRFRRRRRMVPAWLASCFMVALLVVPASQAAIAGEPAASEKTAVRSDGTPYPPGADFFTQSTRVSQESVVPQAAPAAIPELVPVSSPAFSWDDAGVGIAIGVAAGLGLAAVGVFASRRRGHLGGTAKPSGIAAP
jgi:hypothetical protein